MIDLPYHHYISIDLAVTNLNLVVANLDIEALGVVKISRSFSKYPAFIVYQLCFPYFCRLVENIVKSFDNK